MSIELEVDGNLYEFDDENAMHAFLQKKGKSAPQLPSQPDEKSFLRTLLKTSSGRQPQVAQGDLLQRFKESFGNQKTLPEIPDTIFSGLANGSVPLTKLGDIAQFSANIPANLTELPAAILESIPGGTRARQGIGKMLGNYTAPKGEESYLHNKEALTNDAVSLASIFAPEIIAGSQKVYSGVKSLANNGLSSAETGFLGDLLRTTKEAGQTALDKASFGLSKTRRLRKFGEDLNKVGPIETNSKELTGLRSGTQIEDIGNKSSQAYHDFNNALYNRFGNDTQGNDSVRKLLAEKINSLDDTTIAGNAELKSLRNNLLEIQSALVKNPTLSQMRTRLASFGDKAKFGAKERDSINKFYADLYKAGREDLLRGFDKSIVSAGERSVPYRQASKTQDVLLDEKNTLAEAASKNPLWVDSKSGASLVKQPNWAKRVGAERVEAAQSENAAQLTSIQKLLEELDSGNAARGRAAAEEINRRRQAIAKIIDVKRGPVGKLTGKEAGAVVDKAIGTGHLDRNIGGVQDILEANPDYAEPIKNIILSNIKNSSNNPAGLEKMLKKYEEVLPSLFSQEELSALQKLAGTYRRPRMKVDPLADTSQTPFNIRAELPFIQRLLLERPSQQ